MGTQSALSDKREDRASNEAGDTVAPGAGDTVSPAKQRHRRTVLVWTLRGLVAAALLGAWQWYGATRGGVFVPSLTETFASFPKLFSHTGLGRALWESNVAVVVGYPIACLIGVPGGFLIARWRLADRAVSYWLDIAMVIPMVAVVPVIIVAFGLTLSARVAVVVLFTLPIVAMNCRAAVRVTDQSLVEMGYAFGASRRQRWTSVIIPAALPELFAALRIGIGRAISGMIVVELLLVPAGLGKLILNAQATFSTPDLYAVTLVVVAEGVILTSLGHILEHWLNGRMSRSVAGHDSERNSKA